MFEPFKNDHQSMQIGELIFENQTDKVIVYGDIDIVKSKLGLQQALKLQKTFTDMVKELQDSDKKGLLVDSDNLNNDSLNHSNSAHNDGNENLDDTLAKQSQSSKIIDNPFS